MEVVQDILVSAAAWVLGALIAAFLIGRPRRRRHERFEALKPAPAGTAVALGQVRSVCFMLVEQGRHATCPTCYAGVELWEQLVAEGRSDTELPSWVHPSVFSRHRSWLDPSVPLTQIIADSYRDNELHAGEVIR